MLETNTRDSAVAELLRGEPVRYKGVEVPVLPEDQRTVRQARAWLKQHVEAAGVSLRSGRPPVEGLGQRGRPEITDDQADAIGELATKWGVSGRRRRAA